MFYNRIFSIYLNTLVLSPWIVSVDLTFQTIELNVINFRRQAYWIFTLISRQSPVLEAFAHTMFLQETFCKFSFTNLFLNVNVALVNFQHVTLLSQINGLRILLKYYKCSTEQSLFWLSVEIKFSWHILCGINNCKLLKDVYKFCA